MGPRRTHLIVYIGIFQFAIAKTKQNSRIGMMYKTLDRMSKEQNRLFVKIVLNF